MGKLEAKTLFPVPAFPITIHLRVVVSAVSSLQLGMDNLRDGLLYVPFDFSEVGKLLISKGAKLIAKWEVSATAILVAGVVVLGPEVPFVAGFELVNYADKVFVPIVNILLDIELR